MLVALSFALAAGLEVELPYESVPDSLQADASDRFYLDYGDRVIRWTRAEDHVFRYAAPEGYTLFETDHHVGPDGTITSLLESRKSECVDKKCENRVSSYKIELRTCRPDGVCKSKSLGSWKRRSGDSTYTSYAATLRVTERGTPLVAVVRTQHGKENTDVDRTYTCGGRGCDAEELDKLWFAEMAVPPGFRIDEVRKSFYGGDLGPKKRDKADIAGALLDMVADVDITMVYDREGHPHIFSHTSSRRFSHAYVDESSGVGTPVEVEVDGPESGAAHAVVRLGAHGLLAFHYFYRNSYTKGVRATWWEGAEAAPTWAIDLENVSDDNPGWKLRAAATPQGRVLVGYLRDPEKDKRYRLRLFDELEAVRAAEVVREDEETTRYKPWFGMAGVGAQYALWLFGAGGPDAEDLGELADTMLMDSAYAVAPAPLLAASVEARYGRVSLGAAYARKELRRTASEIGAEAIYEKLHGRLGIDSLIKHQDLRLTWRYSNVDLQYSVAPKQGSPDDGRSAEGAMSSAYSRLDIYLLNTWRLRYGLFRQRYSAWIPMYAWALADGETEWTFVDALSAPVHFTDVGVTVGYSRLDYAAKYENKVTDLFVDGDIGLGWSTAMLDTPRELADGTSLDKANALMMPFDVEIGGILLRRNERMRGAGFYTRLGYRAEGSLAGTSGPPGEEEEAAEEARTFVGYDRFELRHGPFLDAGVVF